MYSTGSLERGYDEVDLAKLDNISLKVRETFLIHKRVFLSINLWLSRLKGCDFDPHVSHINVQVGHALVGILRQRELHDQCSAEHALARCCSELLTTKTEECLMRVVYRFAPAAFGAEDVSVWLPHKHHKEALWTSQSSRVSSPASDSVNSQQYGVPTEEAADTHVRDKFLIPFPEWLALNRECETISGSSPHEHLRWASEACSVSRKSVGDSSVVFLLPLATVLGLKPGILLFRLANRRALKNSSAILDLERAEHLRTAVDKALMRVHEEEELLRGAGVLERRLIQHEQLLQLIPQVCIILA
jgi:hypothetical protein